MAGTEAWEEAQAAVPANIVELACIELIHPSFLDANGQQTSIRAVNDTQDQIFLLEASAPLNPSTSVTFTAIPFQVPWPEIQEGQVPELSIKVDNIGQELAPYLDAAVRVSAPITLIFRVYLYDQNTELSTQGIDPITFQLRQVTISESYVEGKASPADLANLQFLRVIYDVLHYPALAHQ